MLKPEPGGICGTTRQSGASVFSQTHPVRGVLFDFYVKALMLDSYLCVHLLLHLYP